MEFLIGDTPLIIPDILDIGGPDGSLFQSNMTDGDTQVLLLLRTLHNLTLSGSEYRRLTPRLVENIQSPGGFDADLAKTANYLFLVESNREQVRANIGSSTREQVFIRADAKVQFLKDFVWHNPAATQIRHLLTKTADALVSR